MRNKVQRMDAVMSKIQPWSEPVDGKALLDEIERFFSDYTSQRGKVFKTIGRISAKKAWKIVENGIAAFGKTRKADRPG